MVHEFLIEFTKDLEKRQNTPKGAPQILIDELGITRSSAYKKLNGSVQMSLEEVFTLSRKFDIPLDPIIAGQSDDRVVFRYPALKQQVMSPALFVEQLLGSLQQLSAQPDLRIQYVTGEIPLFNFLFYPELSALKLYFYSNSAWELPEVENFGNNWMETLLSDAAFQAKRAEIFKIVAQVPTEEFYHINILDTTLRQIQFLCETEQISDNFAAVLFSQLRDMINTLYSWTTKGNKVMADGAVTASYNAHINNIVFTNNMFWVENAAGRLLYSTFDTPNFMICSDTRVIDRIESWFNRIRSKAVQISRQNELNRRTFFQNLHHRVNDAEKLIMPNTL